ncbi:MAG: hypothetical protein QM730_17735 [Anaerolineales bacterium]
MPPSTKPPVELDELLASEFDYIAQTAMQANEDRARVSSFYLIAVGSLIAALFSTQLFDEANFTQIVKFMISGIFTLLTVMGTSTVLQLARLRAAWYESMLAMNQIKDFAMQQNPELTNAFRWRTSTLPKKFKKRSISYFQAIEVSLISGLMLGASIFFLVQAFRPTVGLLHWTLAIPAGIFIIFIQLTLYQRSLQ